MDLVGRAEIDRALRAGGLRLDPTSGTALDAVLRGQLDIASLTARLWDESLQIDAYERRTADVDYFAERKPAIAASLVATDVFELLRLGEGPDDGIPIAATPWLGPATAERISAEVTAIRAERRAREVVATFAPAVGATAARPGDLDA